MSKKKQRCESMFQYGTFKDCFVDVGINPLLSGVL